MLLNVGSCMFDSIVERSQTLPKLIDHHRAFRGVRLPGEARLICRRRESERLAGPPQAKSSMESFGEEADSAGPSIAGVPARGRPTRYLPEVAGNSC